MDTLPILAKLAIYLLVTGLSLGVIILLSIVAGHMEAGEPAGDGEE